MIVETVPNFSSYAKFVKDINSCDQLRSLNDILIVDDIQFNIDIF